MGKTSILIAGIALTALLGCSTQTKQGRVAMKIDDTVAHVSFSPGELEVGDLVKVERIECTDLIFPKSLGVRSRTARRYSNASSKTDCRSVVIGRGTLTEVLNDHYGVAKLDRPIIFKEGDKVSKDSPGK